MKAAKGHTRKHALRPKHHGTGKHRPSAAQHAAAMKWAAAGRAAHHMNVVAKHQGHPVPVKWSPGWDVACCAAEAVGASLRLTGRSVSDADILDLYWRTAQDPDAGATVEATLEAVAVYGLAGVRLVDARRVECLEAGCVAVVDLAEPHAVTVDGGGVWTWGEWRPVSPRFLAGASEAWVISWL